MASLVILALGLATAAAAASESAPTRRGPVVAVAEAHATIFRFERPGDELPGQISERVVRRERGGLIVEYP